MTELGSAQPAALFERLKLETQPWHELIEKDLDLLRTDFTRTEYIRLLARFYGFYAPWEAVVDTAIRGRIPVLLERCHKTSLLQADLQDLGWTDADLSGIALCRDLPDLNSQAAIYGSFYVVEGATLGGQILTRHLTPKLNLEQGGCRFFGGYGAATGSKWKEFRHLAELHCGPEHYDGVIDSARETFASMHRWLCAKDPVPG